MTMLKSLIVTDLLINMVDSTGLWRQGTFIVKTHTLEVKEFLGTHGLILLHNGLVKAVLSITLNDGTSQLILLTIRVAAIHIFLWCYLHCSFICALFSCKC
ncbi:hypothetical protein JHK85_009956 [Glycine max]|uniref:Uncharacterized protein n=2 Tax=Glycine subgen. Soja TaxID=1462606 RepID=A0A0R0KFS7_SOYBN|nr:hypothetical protein JHK87_009570 [Glycine soja]KAG5048853.1 hypothetical protein JHK85_009956 [Glycine max]KAG5065969.1 hypothetical protein JHK86_009700 [Glycine max]RZC16082.1 hypothetical protein D0Y65_009389 [Glycine soja]